MEDSHRAVQVQKIKWTAVSTYFWHIYYKYSTIFTFHIYRKQKTDPIEQNE